MPKFRVTPEVDEGFGLNWWSPCSYDLEVEGAIDPTLGVGERNLLVRDEEGRVGGGGGGEKGGDSEE
ncbi:hypothetical protein [Oryza sativa Japonica Group]|uniref:Uncharacterized protein n=1 Tax=Oryza sativa subsp. japonica TaxID=39947 RepID=Q5ZBX0_ORYSJ|nr:hypothetical protein [Oryza sativa Japonica Group]